MHKQTVRKSLVRDKKRDPKKRRPPWRTPFEKSLTETYCGGALGGGCSVGGVAGGGCWAGGASSGTLAPAGTTQTSAVLPGVALVRVSMRFASMPLALDR